MEFLKPLVHATLVRRYKRFLADVRLDDGTLVTAHCPNSGSMLTVDSPGLDVWLSVTASPKRRLRFTWELIRVGPTLVGINTHRPNALVAEAIAAGRIPELANYGSLRREVRYGQTSRIDILLEAPDRPPCYVEIKNVTMKRHPDISGVLEFPDAPTGRGTKHLQELTNVARSGQRAVMMFLAQRGDGNEVAIASDIDPVYAHAVGLAAEAGVEMIAYGCSVSPTAIVVDRRIECSAFGGWR